jgi:phosphoribosyl 1,2-cyclic phosphodiesterase
VLASGSSGNAALLATDKTRILVDAGLSMKELASASRPSASTWNARRHPHHARAFRPRFRPARAGAQ